MNNKLLIQTVLVAYKIGKLDLDDATTILKELIE